MAAPMAGVASVAPRVNAVTERPQARLNSLNRPFADRDFITESSIPYCRDIYRDRRCYTPAVLGGFGPRHHSAAMEVPAVEHGLELALPRPRRFGVNGREGDRVTLFSLRRGLRIGWAEGGRGIRGLARWRGAGRCERRRP